MQILITGTFSFTLFLVLCTLLNGTVCKPEHLSNQSRVIKIALMGTNDIHGTVFPKKLLREDNKEEYNYGGLVYMARMINIIK